MKMVDIRKHLNSLRATMLGSKVKEEGSARIVVYAAELEALDEALEILKEIED
jgi:ACT domain-containing protein